jgi:hypothetical protein
VHEATRTGRAHDLAHELDRFRRRIRSEQRIDARAEGVTALGDLGLAGGDDLLLFLVAQAARPDAGARSWPI